LAIYRQEKNCIAISMTASAASSLRQRRHRREEENANNNALNTEEDEMELFAEHYKQVTTNNLYPNVKRYY